MSRLGPRRDARWLLCRPRGGLNDMLNQIHVCWTYARRHRRRLVVDSRWSGLLDPLDRYFELRRDPSRVLLAPSRSEEFERLLEDRRPGLARRSTPIPWDAERAEYLEPDTGRPLSFDRSIDHDEELLVHERHGGGSDGWRVLRRLRFTGPVAALIADRVAALPARYVAVHVRNTDLESDAGSFLAGIRAELAGRDVLLASDDLRVRDVARRVVPDARLHWLTTTPSDDGTPLHENPRLDRWPTNVDALVDLIALARAERLHICPLVASGTRTKGSRVSGFSRLAQQLHDRPRVTRGLMVRADRARRAA